VIDLTGTSPWNLTYTWNGINPITVNGITSSPYILTVSEAGTYEITALSDARCNGNGSAGSVTILENAVPFVDLGPDVTIPEGDTLTLDAGPSFYAYLWNDGSTGQTLQVSVSGLYSVTVTDYNGCTNADTVAVTVTTVTGNGNPQPMANDMLKIYPNPSTGMITLEINNPGKLDLRIEIEDVAGRKVYSRILRGADLKENIDLGHLANGTYLVKLSSGSLVKISKLVLID
jgi:hypothetical protein